MPSAVGYWGEILHSLYQEVEGLFLYFGLIVDESYLDFYLMCLWAPALCAFCHPSFSLFLIRADT